MFILKLSGFLPSSLSVSVLSVFQRGLTPLEESSFLSFKSRFRTKRVSSFNKESSYKSCLPLRKSRNIMGCIYTSQLLFDPLKYIVK